MSSEMLAAVVGALIGGIVAFGASWWLVHRDQKRTRNRLATALLVELRSAEHMLNLFATDLDNGTGDFQITHFDRLDEPLLLFDPDAIFRVIDFKNRLQEIRQLRARLSEEKSEARKHRLHSKLVFAAPTVSSLKLAMERNGGLTPPADEYSEAKTYLEMPPRAFQYGPSPKQIPSA